MDLLVIGTHRLNSRLLLGTGKFSSTTVMAQAVRAAGAEIVTVALRRVDLNGGPDEERLVEAIPSGVRLPPRRSCWPSWAGRPWGPTWSSWR